MKSSIPLDKQTLGTPTQTDAQSHSRKQWVIGVGITFLIALSGYAVSQVPWIDHIGPLASAILIAVIVRQICGYPEQYRSGIQFSSKKLLRAAIILYGLKLNMDVIIHQGVGLLVRDAGTIIFSIIIMLLIAKWLKADRSISLLLGIGTGICGAAAIAAISPILKTKEDETAIGVGIIAFIGTLFAVGYTIIRPFLTIPDGQYGIWAGVSLHEIAHVALAGAPAGQDALALALLAKLGRVLLLIPVSFLFMYWMKRNQKNQADTKPEFPWFLIGFIAMSIIGSYASKSGIPISPNIPAAISTITVFLLSMAMVGLGLNVSFHDLRTKALRPLLAVTITSFLLSGITYLTL